MTEGKRIVLNVVATYGRSVYALVVGLFCGRWALMALGEVDYGLVGVVGGLTGFVSFFNGLLAQAVSRFYAFSVGAQKKAGNEEEGLEECRRWFSTAVFIHTTVPLVLILAGYPAGIWAVEHFLTIPPDRIVACVWVWRFVCISCFVGMVNVPFQAMYTAKQEIAELTVYSFATTTLNFLWLYWMVSHPGEWMVKYSCWTMALSVAPQLIITLRAIVKYPECRLRMGYLFSWRHIRQILYFAGFRLWGGVSIMAANQGQAILVNKYLGPASNAAMTIGNTVAQHSVTLAAALDGALYPAITNAAGEGDLEKMRNLSYKACLYGGLFVMLFAIPLCLEVEEVMVLWLKTPPAGSAMLCVCMLAFICLEKLTDGHWMAIFATGRIGAYQFVVSWTGLLALPIAWGLMVCGMGIVGVGIALLVAKVLTVAIRLHYGRKVAGLSPAIWFGKIFSRCSIIALVTCLVGALPTIAMEPSFMRVFLTTAMCEIVFLPGVWFVAFSEPDRSFVMARLKARFCHAK